MFYTALWALLSHWARHHFQLAMLLLGLSVATALWSGVQVINVEARASYARAANSLGPVSLMRVAFPDQRPISLELYAQMRREGWLVSPVIEGLISDTGVTVMGLDPLTLPDQAMLGQGVPMDVSSILSQQNRLFVNAQTAQRLADRDVGVLEVVPDLADAIAIADIGVAQGLLNRAEISYLWLDADSPRPALPPLGIELQISQPDTPQDLARLTDSFHLNLTAFGLLAFIVGLFIVYSSIGLAFEQRKPVFRTLRALGVPAKTLTAVLLAELLVFSTVAGVVGVGLGYLFATLLMPDVAATLRGLYGADVPQQPALRLSWWVAGVAISVLGTLIAAAQSLWRIWHLPILVAAQPQAWARQASIGIRRQAAFGVALLSVGLGFSVFAHGLWAGFALMGSVILAGAMVLPFVLTGMVTFGATLARGVTAQWFWADTRQQLPSVSLALMALLLALSVNISVGTMVASFRLTFVGWLDQRLASEIYLSATTPEQAEEMTLWLAPQAEAILPIWGASTLLFGQMGDVMGMTDHKTYRDNWPLILGQDDVWDQVKSGDGLLVNEQFFRREGLGLGDTVDLPGGALKVVGVYSDYGNPKPQVILSTQELVRRFPDAPRLRFGIDVAPARVPGLIAALRARFDLPETAVQDNTSIKRASVEVFERTFAVTRVLNVLTLAVAGLGMFASLMTLSGMRIAQIAPVWAMGVTKQRLAWLDLLRTIMLAVLTLVLAVPLGLLLAWILLSVVNVAAFGWKLPMYVFPMDWLQLSGLSFLVAGLAAIGPWQKLKKLSPADLLKVFANER